MKTNCAILFFLYALFLGSPVAAGELHEDRSIQSDILQDKVKYAVYLPDDYQISGKKYPVLYLLHGLGWSHRSWRAYCKLIDESIERGELAPMIVVMPNAKRTWYINDYKGEYRYEDMFFTEFMAHIAANYPIKQEQPFQSIAGISMGGHGALVYALRHPELFGQCIAMSAAVYREEDLTTGRHRAAFIELFGPELQASQLSPHWKQNNALCLVPTLGDSSKAKLSFLIDCGDSDVLSAGNTYLHQLMQQHQVKSEYRIGSGAHTHAYWLNSFKHVIKFIARAQAQPQD